MANLKKLITIILPLLITVGFLYSVFLQHSFGEIVAIIARVERIGLAGFVAMSVTALLVRTARGVILLHALDEQTKNVTFFPILVATAIRNALVDIFPARIGELGVIYILSRLGVPIITAGTSLVLGVAIDISVLCLIVIVVLGVSILNTQQIGILRISAPKINEASDILLSFDRELILLATSLVGCISMFFAWRLTPKLFAIIKSKWAAVSDPSLNGWRTRVFRFIEKLEKEFSSLNSSGRLPIVLLLTAILRLLKYGSLYLLLCAVLVQFGYQYGELSFGIVFFSFLIAELAASLPIGGFLGLGVYGSVWGIVFSMAGLSIPVSTIILSVHLITQLVAYGIGGVSAVVFLIYFEGFARSKSKA